MKIVLALEPTENGDLRLIIKDMPMAALLRRKVREQAVQHLRALGIDASTDDTGNITIHFEGLNFS